MSHSPANIASFTRVGQQLGSNPGGKHQDAAGNLFYIKFSKSNDHARNEVLASKLYQAAGAPVLDVSLIVLGNGSLGTLTAWQTPDAPFAPGNLSHSTQARKHFAVHAWLGNWDAIGLEWDNQAIIDGKLTTLDVGGSLWYRAMGERKTAAQFGPTVSELSTMRNPGFNSGRVFGGTPRKALLASAETVAAVSDGQINLLVQCYGPDDRKQGEQLARLLIARRDNITTQIK